MSSHERARAARAHRAAARSPHRLACQAWRELAGRGPLVRRCDTIYAWFAAGLILLALAGLAVVVLVGRGAYGSALSHRERTLTTEHPVAAVALEQPVVGVSRSGVSAHAPIRWTGPDGATLTAVAPVPPDTRTGERVTAWLANDGRPVRPPPPPRVATENAVAAAGMAASGVVAVLMPAHLLGRSRIGTVRDRCWEREWRAWTATDTGGGA